MQHQPVIAVCGAGVCDAQLAAAAEAVGRMIAQRGAILVCGGRSGVMEAACRGAAAAGGITVGILPGERRDQANPYVQVPILTAMGQARNVIIVQTAAVVIAIGGEYGTLSEIALARKLGRPVIGLHTWELGADADGRPRVVLAQTADEAVKLAFAALT